MEFIPPFEIQVKAPIVYAIPNTNLSLTEVQAYFEEIIEASAHLDQWVLFEYAQTQISPTSSFIKATTKNYEHLQHRGCIGIAHNLVNPISWVLRSRSIGELSIPFTASCNPIELANFVDQLIQNMDGNSENMNWTAG